MKGWVELKEAFWAVVEGDDAERERRMASLHAIDASLPAALEALLAADDREERLVPLDDADPQPPTRIGEYEVVERLGAGAMGEVYRARDPRLQRDVAIKVLRTAGWGRADRLARFEREARVLASLDHPRIAHIYGLEAVEGAPAIVMEIVAGPTLAELIRTAPNGLPLPRALALAARIADGLSAAHERGVIHRDLKPGNVALTAQGDVKILDFGIAKRLTDGEAGSAAGDTIAGAMLGTPAYMSPEQARGEACDRRADVWAFGCVLIELMTGRSPFARHSASESLAAVLDHAPDLSGLPAATPAPIRAVIRRCLEKDPGRRLRDMADIRLVLEDACGAPGELPVAEQRRATPDIYQPRQRERRVWLGAGVVAAALLAAAGWWSRGAPEPPARVVAALVLPRDLRLGSDSMAAQAAEANYTVSPDGRKIALVATDSSAQGRLWIADLTSGAFQPLAGTEGAASPFWSPDSERLGFVADGRLRTIPASGGSVVTLSSSGLLAGSWNRHNEILFAPSSRSPLFLVPATGGEARQVTWLDAAAGEVQHSLPQFLPDGRRFLYFSFGTLDGGSLAPRGVFVGSLDAGEPRLLLSDARAVQYADGHLLFIRNNTLMIQAFDPNRIALSGAATSLIEDINFLNSGATGPTTGFSVSAAGVLAYQSLWTETQLEVVDRSGTRHNNIGASGDIDDVAVSPDGQDVAVSRIDTVRGTRDLWVYPVAGGPGHRITFDSEDEFAPVWSPDGTQILYSAMQNGLVGLFSVDADGITEPRFVDTDMAGQGRFAADWTLDGQYLLYIGGGRAIFQSDLWIAPLESLRDARPLLDSTFVETHGRVAPDGRWFAYTSNETGTLEVYVDRFPGRGSKRVVSIGGGRWPRWSHDGRHLYYVASDGVLMEVDLQLASAGLVPAATRALLSLGARQAARLDAYGYDVLPDGRFVVNRVVEEPTASTISLVLNWRPGD